MERLMKTATVASAIFALHLAACAQAAPKTFSTPQEASRALYLAVQARDQKALTAILGAGKELVWSNDTAQDTRDRARFLAKYREMHRVAREPDSSIVLYIGAENWPFPIPLAAENGAWHFDAKAGMEEVLFRRIGENELTATQFCHALALAQREHRSLRPDVAFHGYRFRALGSAFVAYPTVYGSTGVMTYVVDQNDVVYAKDLGPNTASAAKGIRRFEPDSTWHPDDGA